jgi:hypothetical protein
VRFFENKVLRMKNGFTSEDVMRGWRKLHKDQLHNLESLPNKEEYDGRGTHHVWERREMHTGFSWENAKKIYNWKT